MQTIKGITRCPELSTGITMLNKINEQAREIESLKAKCDNLSEERQILLDERFEAQRAAREAAAEESAAMWERIEETMCAIKQIEREYPETMLRRAIEASDMMMAQHPVFERLAWKLRHPIKNRWKSWASYIAQKDSERNYWLIRYKKAMEE